MGPDGQRRSPHARALPGVLPGTAIVADKSHPSTAGLPDRWNRSEVVQLRPQPARRRPCARHRRRADVQPGRQGHGCRPSDLLVPQHRRRRVWTTAMGHAIASYSEADFRNHVLGGVRWAAGNVAGDCGGTVWGNFEKRSLDDNTADPMALAVAPTGASSTSSAPAR
ncbi:ThuA domain-containing protein [Micromonospora sp. M12]